MILRRSRCALALADKARDDRVMSAIETDCSQERLPPAVGRLQTRIPGRARPRALALKEFEEGVAELRRRYRPEFWCFFIPKADDIYRWRVQLECGCVHETFIRGDEDYPDGPTRLDPMTRAALPAGEFWCWGEHGDAVSHYRDVIEWVERRVEEFPPDPEEPQHGLDAEVWAKIRHPEPHSSAFWEVRLACGHVCEGFVTGVGWKPEHGPKLTTRERAAEMRRDFEASWSEEGPTAWPAAGPDRDHMRRMLDLRWPRPEPEQDCRACRYSRRITGYQIVQEILRASADGQRSLVLTNRLEHVDVLERVLSARTAVPVLSLHGRLRPADRRVLRDRLASLDEAQDPFVLVAIDKVAGEGIDLPSLNTLFLAMPVSFKGRVIQQLGRVTRGGEDADAVAVVHDFHDAGVPWLDRMHHRRKRVMAKEGFMIRQGSG